MFDVICNAVSGSGKREKFLLGVKKAFADAGETVVFHSPSSAEETREVVRNLSLSGQKNIVAMGGDGTLNTVLNGIADFSNVSLGLLPCGSGNDFAARIGIPEHPEKAVRILLDKPPKDTDFYECSGVRGINAIGAGIDVEILETYAKMKVFHGKMKYLASLIKVLFGFDLYPMSLFRNGREERHSALIVCAANGATIGGGIQICPEAVPDDGLLDLVLIDNIPKRKIPAAFANLMRGKILNQQYTLHEKTDFVKAVFDRPVSVQIDGEIYPDLPFDVRVISGLLKMYRP